MSALKLHSALSTQLLEVAFVDMTHRLISNKTYNRLIDALCQHARGRGTRELLKYRDLLVPGRRGLVDAVLAADAQWHQRSECARIDTVGCTGYDNERIAAVQLADMRHAGLFAE